MTKVWTQHRGRGSGDRVVPARGACHRVGDVRLDTVLPGPRHGGERWRLGGSLRKRGGRMAPLFSDPPAGRVPRHRRAGRCGLSTGTTRVPAPSIAARWVTIRRRSIRRASATSTAGRYPSRSSMAWFSSTRRWRSSRRWPSSGGPPVTGSPGRSISARARSSTTDARSPRTTSSTRSRVSSIRRRAPAAADLFLGVRGARQFREGAARTVAGLVALDRSTVQVTLDEALAPFVAILAVGHAKIVPRDLVEAQGEAFGAQPVGQRAVPVPSLGTRKGDRADRERRALRGDAEARASRLPDLPGRPARRDARGVPEGRSRGHAAAAACRSPGAGRRRRSHLREAAR